MELYNILCGFYELPDYLRSMLKFNFTFFTDIK